MSYLSDRFNRRTYFLVPLALVVISGYAILLSPVQAVSVRLLGCCLCATGIYSLVGTNIVLCSGSHAPLFKRSTAIGIQQSIANTAGFIASSIYVSRGKKVSLGILDAAWAL